MKYFLDKIQEPIKEQMDSFEFKFREFMKSPVPLLDKITHYIVKRKGKQMRPMFVFLTAELLGKTNESTYRAASLIELLHTATLVHDDVVDDSMERRGFFSVNALWKNKISVLVGDYLLSKGLLLSVDNNDFELLRLVSNSVREMSEGELLQIEKARKLDIDEDVYFEIIRQKTASLIASCCACGAQSVSANKNTVETLRKFGETTGIAFQIKDDLFDFGSSSETGKPTGIDLKEKKMTLPLIFALSQSSSKIKSEMIGIIKNYSEDEKKVEKVIDFVLNSGGIKYSTNKMLTFRDSALQSLEPFKGPPAYQSLVDLVMFTTERTK
jgi:octaprenyl-diphosphate synthase